MLKSVIKLIKKIFFYFLLFTGMILSTSHLGDNFMGISDEEGYLLAIGICCLTAFIVEYLIPKLKIGISLFQYYCNLRLERT